VASPDSNATGNGSERAPEEGVESPVEAGPDALKYVNYSLLLLAFSLLAIVNIAVLVLTNDEVVRDIVYIIDAPLTLIFFVDFLIRLRWAKSKPRYFFREFGWADLLASVPIPAFKVFRAFRIMLAWRIVGHFGARNLRREFRQHRADSALAVIAFLIIVAAQFGGIAVILAERTNAEANIKTASDAIWWAAVTIGTLGYGDRYPITDPGRIVGLAVMIIGVALLGVLTGYLANSFLSPPKPLEEKNQTAQPAQQPDPKAMVAEMKLLILEQEKAQEKLRNKLAELEQLTR
jgi:ion channel